MAHHTQPLRASPTAPRRDSEHAQPQLRRVLCLLRRFCQSWCIPGVKQSPAGISVSGSHPIPSPCSVITDLRCNVIYWHSTGHKALESNCFKQNPLHLHAGGNSASQTPCSSSHSMLGAGSPSAATVIRCCPIPSTPTSSSQQPMENSAFAAQEGLRAHHWQGLHFTSVQLMNV